MPDPPVLNLVIQNSSWSNNDTISHKSNEDKPPSPVAPPYSPITPVMPSASIPESESQIQYGSPLSAPLPPPLLPFSENDNPDAIALRSAISILQIQRQQSLQDLKTLEQQKQIAVADPEAFAAELSAGRVKTSSSGKLLVGPRFNEPLRSTQLTSSSSSYSSDDDNNDNDEPPPSKFSPIPGPQNIIRAPPINWAKYHIVGEALDKLHDEQCAKPNSGQPRRDEDQGRSQQEHVIVAPYNPWVDKLVETPGRGKGGMNE